MYITRKTDYAVRCIIFLSMEAGRTVSAGEISKAMLIPKDFLAKILQRLSRKGIVKSTKGVAGGFRLAKEPGKISLLEVIEAIQGPTAANACAVDENVCSLSGTCAVHPVWVELRKLVEERLKGETFAKLISRC